MQGDSTFCQLKEKNAFATIDEESFYAYYDCSLQNPKGVAVEYVGTDRKYVRATIDDSTELIDENTAWENFKDLYDKRAKESQNKPNKVEVEVIKDSGKVTSDGKYTFDAKINCEPSNLCAETVDLNEIKCEKADVNYKCTVKDGEKAFDENGNLPVKAFKEGNPPTVIDV